MTSTQAETTRASVGDSGKKWIPGPLLPQKYRRTNRPKLWLEIALIAIGYELYTLTRLAAPTHEAASHQRGWDILNLEHYLGLNFEHTVNHWVYSVRWLAFSMNVYYGTLHFIVPIVVLIWVYLKFPDRYRSVRTVMCTMTLLALFGFYFYSLCPPRLLPGADFIDTFKLLNPWGQSAATSDGVAGLGTSTNEFAAMPSLHIGWSTWCAIVIARLATRNWVKILGIAYPFATFAVIIGTANHYALDAVGGLVVLGLGFLFQRILQGRPAISAPPPVPSPVPSTVPAEVASVPKQPVGSDAPAASAAQRETSARPGASG
ncbi:MAG: phosphatase PAP2 family protein [Catenulispora sp.]|nr:phosphatase PAP2 family protein [Catenulispora sp.]